MTLSDLESLGKIFNDTKCRAVSLRQLSFLFCTAPGYLCDVDTDRRESLQNGRAMTQYDLLPFWWR